MNALIDSATNLKSLIKFEWKNTKFEGITGISENIETVCDILGREFTSLIELSVHMNYNLKYCHWKEGSVLGGLSRLPALEGLSIGVAGACACNNFYTCIQQFNHLKSLTIESPLVFAGRSCLPCTKIISNHLPNIFDKLQHLTSLRMVYINPKNRNFLNEIITKIPKIQTLHLIGFHNMNGEKLLFVIRNATKLTELNLQESRFTFTRALYSELVEECQQNNRFLRISVSQGMKRALFASLKDGYRKEFVQILS